MIAARALSLPIIAYRWTIAPLLGPNCRFTPSCSAYALDAIRAHGAARGAALAAARIVRCNPWCAGGHDPVPPTIAQADKPGRRRWNRNA